MFDAWGEPTEAAKIFFEKNSENKSFRFRGESEAFREIIATVYHSFCRDFQLDEKLRTRTEQIVNTYQRAFMQFDFKHLLAWYRDIGSQVLDEVGFGWK